MPAVLASSQSIEFTIRDPSELPSVKERLKGVKVKHLTLKGWTEYSYLADSLQSIDTSRLRTLHVNNFRLGKGDFKSLIVPELQADLTINSYYLKELLSIVKPSDTLKVGMYFRKSLMKAEIEGIESVSPKSLVFLCQSVSSELLAVIDSLSCKIKSVLADSYNEGEEWTNAKIN